MTPADATSAFDPETFLNTSQSGANATKYDPVPPGDYQALCDKVASRVATSDKGSFPILDLTWKLIAPEAKVEELKTKLNRQEITVRQSIFLDVNENGALEYGPNKNVQLGRVREALKQNDAGRPWSPKMLEGAGPVLIAVENNPDRNDKTIMRDSVAKVVGLNK